MCLSPAATVKEDLSLHQDTVSKIAEYLQLLMTGEAGWLGAAAAAAARVESAN